MGAMILSLPLALVAEQGTGKLHLPTLTAVRPPSSSEARLPPPALLVMLKRLLLRVDGFIMALIGRGVNDMPPGDPGGDVAMIVRVITAAHSFSYCYRYSKNG